MESSEPSGTSKAESSTSPLKQRIRRKVSRTRAGCTTCKTRRKRCDLVKPNCGDCIRLNLQCEWEPVRKVGQPRHGSKEGHDGTAAGSRSSSSPYRPPEWKPTPDVVLPPIPTNDLSQSSWSSLPMTGLSDSTAVPTLSTSLGQSSNSRTDITAQEMFGGNLFPPQSNPIDDAILQLWAEACAPFLATEPQDEPSGEAARPILPVAPPSIRSTITDSIPPLHSASPLPKAVPDAATQTEILTYFRECLTGLISYDEVLFPDSLHAFNATASANIGNAAGRALHCGILALASRHMVNKGQICMERVSEQLGVEGSEIIMERLKDIDKIEDIAEEEAFTLLAGLLMHIIYKICRGDVWGFDGYLDQAKRLCRVLFPLESSVRGLSSAKFSFLENVIYHDSCGSYVCARGPMLDPKAALAYVNTRRGTPHPATGLALPLYCIAVRIAGLVQRSWTHRSGQWNDKDLAEVLKGVQELEATLEEERQWLESFLSDRPDMTSHRYFHDAFRIACLLQLKCFVLGLTPDSLVVRSLVRNALSLLETMEMLNLPGFVSAHWILFTVAICSTSSERSGQPSANGTVPVGMAIQDDRQRASKLYDTAIDRLAFLNMSRSKQLVRKLWDSSQGGTVLVHWLDVVADVDWEIIFA